LHSDFDSTTERIREVFNRDLLHRVTADYVDDARNGACSEIFEDKFVVKMSIGRVGKRCSKILSKIRDVLRVV